MQARGDPHLAHPKCPGSLCLSSTRKIGHQEPTRQKRMTVEFPPCVDGFSVSRGSVRVVEDLTSVPSHQHWRSHTTNAKSWPRPRNRVPVAAQWTVTVAALPRTMSASSTWQVCSTSQARAATHSVQPPLWHREAATHLLRHCDEAVSILRLDFSVQKNLCDNDQHRDDVVAQHRVQVKATRRDLTPSRLLESIHFLLAACQCWLSNPPRWSPCCVRSHSWTPFLPCEPPCIR